MNNVSIKKVVCLVSDEELRHLRAIQRHHKHPNAPVTSLNQRVWREIRVTATDAGIAVHLGNIDEDAVISGHWGVSECCVRFNLTWADLADVNGLENALRFEPMVVAKPVLDILAKLKTLSNSVQDVLAI